MHLPTKADINVYDSPDEQSASDHFFGKTLVQVEILFRESSEYYQEDLMWMGPVAFSFYLKAAINYLRSHDSAGDYHLIDCLYEIAVFRFDQEGFALAINGVKEMVDYVIADYQKFQVNTEIYGDLLKKYKSLKNRLTPIG